MHWIWLVHWVTWLSCPSLAKILWPLIGPSNHPTKPSLVNSKSWSHDSKTLYILLLPLERHVVECCELVHMDYFVCWLNCGHYFYVQLVGIFYGLVFMELFTGIFCGTCICELCLEIYLQHWNYIGLLGYLFKRITARTWTLKEQLNCFSTWGLAWK